jgi:hypothetical protein
MFEIYFIIHPLRRWVRSAAFRCSEMVNHISSYLTQFIGGHNGYAAVPLA